MGLSDNASPGVELAISWQCVSNQNWMWQSVSRPFRMLAALLIFICCGEAQTTKLSSDPKHVQTVYA